MYRQPKPAAAPADYPAGAWPLWFVSMAFVQNRRFGSWFLLGLVVETLLLRFGVL
jgi:hypothetical protein